MPGLQLKDKTATDPRLAELSTISTSWPAGVCAAASHLPRRREDLADMSARFAGSTRSPSDLRRRARPRRGARRLRPPAGRQLTVELNGDALPRVIANRRYYARVSRTKDPAARASSTRPGPPPTGYPAPGAARPQDPERVASEIVRQQFVLHVRRAAPAPPLNLKMIAEASR